MNNNIDINQTERNSFKLAAYADGTADISLGLAIVLLGLYPLTREVFGPGLNLVFFFAVLGLIVFAQSKVKTRLIPDRIGIVKLGERAKKRAKIALLITSVLVGLTVLTWVLSANGYFLPSPAFPRSAWMGRYGFDILIGVIVLAIFFAMAYTLELTRYYLYGVLLGLTFPLQTLLPVYSGFPSLMAGIVITGFGIFLLTNFLKKYPVMDGEEGIRNG